MLWKMHVHGDFERGAMKMACTLGEHELMHYNCINVEDEYSPTTG